MLYKFSEEELRSICRKNIESLEKWARIIVDKKLKESYGENYFYYKSDKGESLIKKAITDKSREMMERHPNRYSKPIDTLFLDEIKDILCNPNLYKKHFREFLSIMYPNGNEEVRIFLQRIIPIRNKLSHTNPLSIREAEQCVCYCNDFIDGVKKYYKQIGEERVYNVPNAIRLRDSLGKSYDLENAIYSQEIYIGDGNGYDNLHKFEVGDKYSVWLDLDPSFDEDEYNFRWHTLSIPINSEEFGTKPRLDLIITEKFISTSVRIMCMIKSNKGWHKHGTYDQKFAIIFQVLPPRE